MKRRELLLASSAILLSSSSVQGQENGPLVKEQDSDLWRIHSTITRRTAYNLDTGQKTGPTLVQRFEITTRPNKHSPFVQSFTTTCVEHNEQNDSPHSNLLYSGDTLLGFDSYVRILETHCMEDIRSRIFLDTDILQKAEACISSGNSVHPNHPYNGARLARDLMHSATQDAFHLWHTDYPSSGDAPVIDRAHIARLSCDKDYAEQYLIRSADYPIEICPVVIPAVDRIVEPIRLYSERYRLRSNDRQWLW